MTVRKCRDFYGLKPPTFPNSEPASGVGRDMGLPRFGGSPAICVDPMAHANGRTSGLACLLPLNHTKCGRATKPGQAHSARLSAGPSLATTMRRPLRVFRLKRVLSVREEKLGWRGG